MLCRSLWHTGHPQRSLGAGAGGESCSSPRHDPGADPASCDTPGWCSDLSALDTCMHCWSVMMTLAMLGTCQNLVCDPVAMAVQAAATDIIRERWRGTTAGTGAPAADRELSGLYAALMSLMTSASDGPAVSPPAAEAAASALAAAAPPPPAPRGAYVEQRVRECVGLPVPAASGRIVALGDSTAPRSDLSHYTPPAYMQSSQLQSASTFTFDQRACHTCAISAA